MAQIEQGLGSNLATRYTATYEVSNVSGQTRELIIEVDSSLGALEGSYGPSLKDDTTINLSTPSGTNYLCTRDPGPWSCLKTPTDSSSDNGTAAMTPSDLRSQLQQMFPGDANPPVSERTIAGLKTYCVTGPASGPYKGIMLCIATNGVVALSQLSAAGQTISSTLKSVIYTVNPADFTLPGPVMASS